MGERGNKTKRIGQEISRGETGYYYNAQFNIFLRNKKYVYVQVFMLHCLISASGAPRARMDEKEKK